MARFRGWCNTGRARSWITTPEPSPVFSAGVPGLFFQSFTSGVIFLNTSAPTGARGCNLKLNIGFGLGSIISQPYKDWSGVIFLSARVILLSGLLQDYQYQ